MKGMERLKRKQSFDSFIILDTDKNAGLKVVEIKKKYNGTFEENITNEKLFVDYIKM